MTPQPWAPMRPPPPLFGAVGCITFSKLWREAARPLVVKTYTSETELAYDDGALDTTASWEIGKGFAVRFTPPAGQVQLMRTRYYLQDPRPIEVHVWDENRTDLITPFAAATSQDGLSCPDR